MTRALRFGGRYVAALLLSVYALTAGLFSRRGRELLILVCEHFGVRHFSPPRIRAELQTVHYGTLIADCPITIAEPVARDGNVRLDELAIINGIVARHRPRTIFEIGTFDGRTTVNLAQSSPEDCRVFTLDLPAAEQDRVVQELGTSDPRNVRRHYDLQLASRSIAQRATAARKPAPSDERKIHRLYGNSMQFDFSPYFNQCDLVFIDAAHTFDYVLNDSQIALKLLRGRKGIILWHDYADDMEVVDAINAFAKAHPGLAPVVHIDGTTLAYLHIP